MKYRFMSAVSAAALAASLIVAPVSAQDLGLKQLQDSAISSMAKLNMDTSMVDMLTLDELAQIQAVTASGATDEAKTMRIETVLDDAETRIAETGVTEPSGPTGDINAADMTPDMVVKANVGSYLAELGMAQEVDVDTLSTEELLQIQLVQESSETSEGQRMQIERLLTK